MSAFAAYVIMGLFTMILKMNIKWWCGALMHRKENI